MNQFTSSIDYGFDAADGFIALDYASQTARYAYPTSAHAIAAKVSPRATAAKMLTGARRIPDDASHAENFAYWQRRVVYGDSVRSL